MSCKHSFFFDGESNSFKCEVAREDCGDDYDLVNFFSFTFCWLGGHWGVFLAFCVVLILVIFRFITITIEGKHAYWPF